MKKIIQREKVEFYSDLTGRRCYKDTHYSGGSLTGSYMVSIRNGEDDLHDYSPSIEIDMTPYELFSVLDFLIKKYPKSKSECLKTYREYKKRKFLRRY